MREEGFKDWLVTVHGLNERTARNRLSNCRRVEAHERDLDRQWEEDELVDLIDRLTYSKQDQHDASRPRHGIQIDGDIYHGTATLKQAVVRYREFRSSERGTNSLPNALAKQKSQGRLAGRPRAGWPVWSQPSDENLLKLAQAMAPFVRFLDPRIVYAVVEDNRRMAAAWSARLEAFGIDPTIYLWEGSPCAFPGVRRHAGSTKIAVFRQRTTPDKVPPQCLVLDDNDYPKHLWAFVFTGKSFSKRGPNGYQLAHLFDHKEYRNRWRDELDYLPDETEPVLPYGLFTSAANSVYLPSAFLRPTDFSSRLRSLIQRRALQLYGKVCRIVPPPLAVKPCEDETWALDNFLWSAPLGDVNNVRDFLEFRRQRMIELIDKRRVAMRTDGTPGMSFSSTS